jgi:NAD-dependent deacetylase
MKKVVVFTGAGISAESGLKTFRGDGGLWEGHSVEDVATPEAWATNPALVLEFYNQRRQQVRAAQPNAAHKALVNLKQGYDVRIITHNVDDLHGLKRGRSSLPPGALLAWLTWRQDVRRR